MVITDRYDLRFMLAATGRTTSKAKLVKLKITFRATQQFFAMLAPLGVGCMGRSQYTLPVVDAK